MKKAVMTLVVLGFAAPLFAQNTQAMPNQGRIEITDWQAAENFKKEIQRAAARASSQEATQEKRCDNCAPVRTFPMSQEEVTRQLRLAFEYEDWDGMVDLIGQNGADITTVVKNEPLTHERANELLLTSASWEDWGSVLSLIEDSGADIEITDDGGNTVLMFAAESGSAALVRYLVFYKNVSDEYINAVNKAGETALSLAQNEEIIEMLMPRTILECGD